MVGSAVAIAVRSRALRKVETIIATKASQNARLLGADFGRSAEFGGTSDMFSNFESMDCVELCVAIVKE